MPAARLIGQRDHDAAPAAARPEPDPGIPDFRSADKFLERHLEDLRYRQQQLGGADHVYPPKVSEADARLQRKSAAITAYREFPGRPHLILAGQGWEDVADFALEWALDPTEDIKPD